MANNAVNNTLWDMYLYEFQDQWNRESAFNYFFICVMVTFASLGTIANLVVILSLVILRDLHKIEYAFVGNLAVADLLVTVIVIPVNILVTVRGPAMFRDYPWFCELDGTICASACSGSIWCITAISLERYICICHYSLYQRMFTFFRTVLMVVGLWIIAHSIHLPNFLGWGETAYSSAMYLCTAELRLWSYSVFYGVTAVVLPIGISFYAYLRIYLKVRVSRAGRNQIAGTRRTTVSTRAGSEPASLNPKKQLTNVQEEIKLLKALFKLFLIFLASWLMIGLQWVGSAWLVFPKWYSYLALILAHGSSATNSVIYFWMTDLMQITKNGYLRLYRRFTDSRRGVRESGLRR